MTPATKFRYHKIVPCFERQKDTRFPSYIMYVGTKPVYIVEQAGGSKNGWCVYDHDRMPGDPDCEAVWIYNFVEAKGYARKLWKERVADGQN